MGRRLKANALAVKAAAVEDGKRTIYSIDGVTGLRLYLEPSGSRAWQFEYNVAGRRHRVHLGDAAVVSLADARAQAVDLRRSVQTGGNPRLERMAAQQEAAQSRFTFRRLLERWEKAHRHLKGLKERIRALEKDALPAIGDLATDEITKRDIILVIDSIADRGARAHADHVAAYLSAIFNWGIDEDLCQNNPCHRIRKRAVKRVRERVLSDDELVRLWHALSDDSDEVGDVADLSKRTLKLALLTGQRRGELIAALVSEFDTRSGIWTLPGGRTKNGRTHALPLAPAAVDLVHRTIDAYRELGSDYLFPASTFTAATPHIHPRSASKALENICRRLDIEGVSMHCFRRTMATRMGDMGVPGDVISRVLNHSPQDVTSRHYNHAKMLSQMRDALEQWEAHILKQVENSEAL